MDIKLKKRPWYVRYRYFVTGAFVLLAILVWAMVQAMGPRRLRVDAERIRIAEVETGKFMEYIDVEGLVQPILTIKVNTRELGFVERIVAEEGSMLRKGDTILVLSNPDLLRSIHDQRDEWEKQLITYREKEIEMEQGRLTLQKQALQTDYELSRLQKSYVLDKEEYQIGIKSKAELEVSQDEYEYKKSAAILERKRIQHDSVMAVLRKDLLRNDRDREEKKLHRSYERIDDMVVRAPYDGQLSFVRVTPGQQVGTGESIAEIKVLDQFKIHTALSEYYIDRITTGLPASILYQNNRYALKITKVLPEVKDRTFDVDLVFTGNTPDNIRIGKSYRVQVELGQPEEAVVIPRGNFYQATGGRWIYKVNASGTHAVRTPIVIGRQNPQQYEIIEGLSPGDRVISTGYDTFGEAEELILK